MCRWLLCIFVPCEYLIFSEEESCISNNEVKCKPIRFHESITVCTEHGSLPHPHDCAKFFKCLNRGNVHCLCKCAQEESYFHLEEKKCKSLHSPPISGHCRDDLKKKIPIPEFKLDQTGGNEILHPVFKMMEDFRGQKPARRHFRDSFISINKSKIVNVIDDNFPVWVITVLVSCMVTAAVGMILYFY